MLDFQSVEPVSKSVVGKVIKAVIPIVKRLPKPTICVKF
jgi:hypothetical protein